MPNTTTPARRLDEPGGRYCSSSTSLAHFADTPPPSPPPTFALTRRVHFQVDGKVLTSPPSPPSTPAAAAATSTATHDATDDSTRSSTRAGGDLSTDFVTVRELAAQRAAGIACIARGLGLQVVSPATCGRPPPPSDQVPSTPTTPAVVVASLPTADCPILRACSATELGSEPRRHALHVLRQPFYRAFVPSPMTYVSAAMCTASQTSSDDASLVDSALADDNTQLPMLFPEDDPLRGGSEPASERTPLSMPTVENLPDGERADSGSAGGSRSSPPAVAGARASMSFPLFVPRPGQPSPISFFSLDAAVNANNNAHFSPNNSHINSRHINNRSSTGSNLDHAATLSGLNYGSVVGLVNHGAPHLADGGVESEPLTARTPDVSTNETDTNPFANSTIATTAATERDRPPRELRRTSSVRHTAGTWRRAAPPLHLPPSPPALQPRTQRFSISLRDAPALSMPNAPVADDGAASLPNAYLLTDSFFADIAPPLLQSEISSAEDSTSLGFSGLSALESHALGVM